MTFGSYFSLFCYVSDIFTDCCIMEQQNMQKRPHRTIAPKATKIPIQNVGYKFRERNQQ